MKKLIRSSMALAVILLMIGCESVEFRSAKMYVNENDLENAETFFLQALQTEPGNALVPYLLAKDVYVPQKRWAEMNKMFTKALEINPDAKLPQFYRVGDEVITTVGQAIEIQRQQEWSKIFNEGVEQLNRDETDKAIASFKLAIDVLPLDGKAYKALYSIYAKQGNQKKALNAIKDAPIDMDLLILKGDLAKADEDYSKAESLYLQALELSTDSKDSDKLYLRLFEVKFLMDDYPAAQDYADKISDYNGDIAYNLGALYHRMAIEKYNTAVDAYNEMISASHVANENFDHIIELFLGSKDLFKKARGYFMDAISYDPDDNESRRLAKELKKKIKIIDKTFIQELESMKQ